jgi:hypothetical protein
VTLLLVVEAIALYSEANNTVFSVKMVKREENTYLTPILVHLVTHTLICTGLQCHWGGLGLQVVMDIGFAPNNFEGSLGKIDSMAAPCNLFWGLLHRCLHHDTEKGYSSPAKHSSIGPVTARSSRLCVLPTITMLVHQLELLRKSNALNLGGALLIE